jgi:ELWxxDGT repeat protein
VKDIAPRSASEPLELTRVGRRLFFTAREGVHGRELWRSDGSRAGTVLVKDITPSDAYYASSPRSLSAVGRRLFLAADDGRHGRELWSSDGTRAGTVLVRDIAQSNFGDWHGSHPHNLTPFGGRVFFVADPTTSDNPDNELWRSDGTRAGTVLVKNINPASDFFGFHRGSSPAELTVLGDSLFFSAGELQHGWELWESDGTRAGTVLVKDINPATVEGDYGEQGLSSGPGFLTPLGEAVFFAANDEAHGRELWSTDGTTVGTHLVKDLNPEAPDGAPAYLRAFDGQVFFTADDGIHSRELWSSDGTDVGTSMVADIDQCEGTQEARKTQPSALSVVGDRLFFAADDGIHGQELWTSDGTPEGTVMVRDIRK